MNNFLFVSFKRQVPENLKRLVAPIIFLLGSAGQIRPWLPEVQAMDHWQGHHLGGC